MVEDPENRQISWLSKQAPKQGRDHSANERQALKVSDLPNQAAGWNQQQPNNKQSFQQQANFNPSQQPSVQQNRKDFDWPPPSHN